ncbi:54S ribosomal protein L15, mitochondrial [Candida viswanathii]|uniref:54S ribosomal protein L15, mitochondrial n=1 Tax=Candida viswanathii TaxID=5486 RepID=A0A367YE69_9ASCO|nr:54S ribosomal protein L15, mitochondrial [Candida viswanathii]
MMTIRTLTARSSGFTASIFTRSVYLHAGPRIEGLKRDPNAAFVNPKGIKYGLTESNIAPVKTFLGQEYAIPDEVILQVITHKSFGNGIKPHNEKLMVMGSKLLTLFFVKHVTNPECKDESRAINGKNLDVLGGQVSRGLASVETAGIFAQASKLNEVMFWKSSNSKLGFHSSGERKVSGQMLSGLVGAVNFYHGKDKAEKFISEKLVDAFEKITFKYLLE